MKSLRICKVSIEPLNKEAVISKKVQIFNNSVGYASKEMGGNLIVKEQWLESPGWNIYLLIDNDEAEKISEYILNNKAIYQPYLGKNDHYANISEVELLDNCIEVRNVSRINSLCLKDEVSLEMPDIDLSLDNEDDEENIFRYCEKLPYKLNEETSLYEVRSFVFSNMDVRELKSDYVYRVKDKNIVFF